MQKRHKSYKTPKEDENIVLLEVYRAIEYTAVYGLRLRPFMDPEGAVELITRMSQN
jgi:hypothetical protein